MQDTLVNRLKRDISYQPPPIEQVMRPFQEFFRVEASSGILLVISTVIAIVWANSPMAESYFALWETKFTVFLGDFGLSKDLLHWINDGLMAVFFFVVGLEIKRELLIGELSSARKAILPIAAAIGGMVVPAAIYALIVRGGEGAAGWGIPMATDIAFALGVLALLGKGVPAGLKIFLAALAIVDDLGAVLVIAVFYTSEILWIWLAAGVGFFALMLLANRLGVRHPVIYGALGIALWFCFLESGVHATIAGVLAAMTIPATARIKTDEFVAWSHGILHEFQECCSEESENGRGQRTTISQRSLLQALETAIQQVEAPLQRLEHALEYPNAYTIMPIFALANAGVVLGTGLLADLTSPVGLGIVFGLLIGKQLGITLFSWLAVRSGLASLPQGVTWRHVYGASWLGGIGFTMSLFIDGLAFDGSPLLDTAKVAILFASTVAGVAGYLILRGASRRPEAVASTTRQVLGQATAQPMEG